MLVRLRHNVSLGTLAEEHAAAMYSWMRDPEVAANIGLRSVPSLAKTRAWLASAAQEHSIRGFAVLLDGKHVGNVVLDRIEPFCQSARLSIYIGDPKVRKRGVGTTAAYLALAEAFGALNLHKVWLTVHCRNVRAIDTYLRLGFVIEGVLRDEFRLGAERLSVFYMGLLRDEFSRLSVPSAEVSGLKLAKEDESELL